MDIVEDTAKAVASIGRLAGIIADMAVSAALASAAGTAVDVAR